jgi:hypothetical protein
MEEDTHLDAQEFLDNTQEPDQDTFGKGLNTLLEEYLDEEENTTSIEPQERVDSPSQEKSPIEIEDPSLGNEDEEEEASTLPPKKL